MAKFNNLIFCFGKYSYTTTAGYSIHVKITLPISYTNTAYKVFMTNFRDNDWAYDVWYSTCSMVESINEITLHAGGLNNQQYISGIDWLTIGY